MSVMQTPYASPDTLRAFLQASKKFYDLHVPRNFGFTDLPGLKYVSTVENFGSEALLETRKLRMDRPPTEVVKPNAYMQYYFNIMHSDLINTYDQQNLLMAMLKQNTMLHDHSYALRFTDAEIVYVLRAEAYGDDDVVRASKFLKTYTNPELLIDGEPVSLFVGDEDNTDHHVTWFFALNKLTEDYIASLTEADLSYTLVTIDLVSLADLPFIWFCTEDMRMLPNILMTGNEDSDGDPILTFGTDCQNVNRLYPMITDGLLQIQSTGHWYIQAHGDFKYMTGQHIEEANPLEFDSKITYLEICWRDGPMPSGAWSAPDIVMPIEFDSTFAKMTMAPTRIPGIPVYTWSIRTPKSGDYDYSSAPYNNTPVAYCMLHNFEGNIISDENPNPELMPALTIKFDDKFYHPYESEINQFRTGVHVDCTSDYSDHSVEKKCGVVYRLGDFDGLPEFYQRYLDRTIHHAHVEMYAIRDDANVRNQKPMDKQTAAIILDSAVPQNDLKQVTDDMEPVIVYQYDRHYVTDESKIVSNVNFLSNVGFVDKNHFADATIEGRQKLQKFVYHGKRRFSIGIVEFDERTEYGRGYLLSNDGIHYENNETSRTPKAPRTAARICDIPTSFEQLQNISGVSPTLVIDTKYTRQRSMMTPEQLELAWSDRDRATFWLTSIWSGQPEIIYFPDLMNLRHFTTPSGVLQQNGVPSFDPIDVKIDLNNTDHCSHELFGTIQGYFNVGDCFGFNIGGIFIKGVITAVQPVPGGVLNTITDYLLTINHDIPDQPEAMGDIISLANLNGRVSTFETVPLNYYNPNTNPSIKITVEEDVWARRVNRDHVYIPNPLRSYVYDENTSGISVTEWDNDESTWGDAVQLTGDLDVGNVNYDDPATRPHRDIRSVMLYNMLSNTHIEDDDIFDLATRQKSIEFECRSEDFDPPTLTIEQLNSGQNMASYVSDYGLNVWNCFLAIVPARDASCAYVMNWYYDMNASYIPPRSKQNGNLIFPKRSGLNVNDYDDSWSAIKLTYVNGKPMPFMYDIMHKTYDSYEYDGSTPIRLTSQSNIGMYSLLPMDEYPENAMPIHNDVQAHYNIYRFDHLDQYKELIGFREALEGSSASSILQMITDKFGENTIANKYYSYTVLSYGPNTDYIEDVLIADDRTNKLYRSTRAFRSTTVDQDLLEGNLDYIGPNCQVTDLINYYFENLYHRPLYNETRVQLYAHKGEIMTIPDNDPIGGFVPIRETVHTQVTMDRAPYTAEPMYAFSVTVPDLQLEDFLHNFRMYDGSVDISANTMMIINGKQYLFYNDEWHWNYHA